MSTETMTAAEYQEWLAQQQKREPKYGNERTTVDGIAFDSKAEADHYQTLRNAERGGAISDLVMQPRFPLMVNGELIGTYVADFQYVDGDGQLVVEDVKGMRTPVYKLKKKLVKAVHGIDVMEIE